MERRRLYIVASLFLVVVLCGFLYIDLSGNGLRNYEEIINGANPLQEDTDGDGISDYEEIVLYNTNPRSNDTSQNGLSDYEEIVVYGTEPNKKDTIGNGLTDYEEVEKFGTDPLSFDTDSDGLTDYDEVKVYATNPNYKDTDKDGLTDYKEVKEYSSNPIRSDTDDDGVSDYEEIKLYGSDPTKQDSNGDGLTDVQNINIGTDPVKLDSSGDGFLDVYAFSNQYINGSSKTILVQVSYMEGVKIPNRELEEIESEFKEESNNSFSLEFIIDDSPVERESELSITDYYDDYYNNRSVFTRRGMGYYHVLAVPQIDESNIEGSRVVFGATTSKSDGILVQERRNDEIFAMTFAHELGHQLGLEKNLFEGIDSRSYDADEYPSSMNYDWTVCIRTSSCDEDYIYTYSDGRGFDDWGFISETFTEHQPSKIRLKCSTEIDCTG